MFCREPRTEEYTLIIKRGDPVNQTRAAVIGSGFGGLTLAVRLQAAGIATTVIEKRDKPGGRAYVYEDKGYTFDGGPTIITAPPSLEEVFAAAGREMSDYITLLPVMPFYRLYWEDGYSFDYSNDLEATTQQIADKSPSDVDGYMKFLDYAENVFDEGYTKLAATPFLNFWSMIQVSPSSSSCRATAASTRSSPNSSRTTTCARSSAFTPCS